MALSELKKLIVEEFLAFVDEPRVERTHSLETIIVMSLLAVISGADRNAIDALGFARSLVDREPTALGP